MSSQKRIIDKEVTTTATAAASAGDAINMDYIYSGSIQCIFTDETPSPTDWTSTDVNTTDNTITITAHGFGTGLIGQVSTAGTLPNPLATSTDYYVIVVDDDTIKLATSLANAQAGTAIDLTTQGAGTSTFTATALDAGISFEINNKTLAPTGIPDPNTWETYGTETTITADGQEWLLMTAPPGFQWVRYYYRVDAGQINTDNIIIMKGNQP